MKIYAFITICIAFLSMTEMAIKYPAGDFVSPINREIKLSGTFGELRTNHFHAGLDIKSLHQVIGDPIYSAGDGYISRIKVDEFGYGNAIFIDHLNGYTSLYGHLDRFYGEIESYVKEQQYLQKSFEVDLYPGPFKFPVTRMEQIGYMGNTGSSLGAHLHFEIRRTNDQSPVNPLLFGFDVCDHKAPVIQQLIVYELDENDQMITSHIMQPKLMEGRRYSLEKPIELPAGKVAFGIRTYDTQDSEDNQNGVYSIQCKADDEPTFSFALNEFPFEQARYINAHIDYREKINENLLFHRCYVLEGNKLPIYSTGSDKGRFAITAENPRHFTVTVADFNGNTSTVDFSILQSQVLAPLTTLPLSYEAIGIPDEVTIITEQGIQVVWPEGSFYQRTPLNVVASPNFKAKGFSPAFELSPVDEPVHGYFDIYVDGSAVPNDLQPFAFIARCEPNGSVINCGGTWIGKNLTTAVKQMGTYAIMIDTIAPKITPVHFANNMSGWRKMDFRISDNMRIRDKGKNISYSAYVDGSWILMSLDGKTGMITHIFDGHITPGSHDLILKVTDDRGNESVLEKTFTL
jgi:murein DD-endopeptidase MepM/ murein hydrolase activator NlpD